MNLKKAVDLLVVSQIFVAFCGTLLVFFFNQNLLPEQIIIVFLTFLGGYLLTKFRGSRFQKYSFFANIFLGILIFLLYYNLNFQYLYRWLCICIFGIFYNSFFSFRKIPFAKNFYVGAVWALMCAWLFAENFDLKIFLSAFFFVSALIIPFDIRDLEADRVYTFPNFFGVKISKIFAIILLIISMVVVYLSLGKLQIIGWILTSIITVFLILKSKTARHRYFYSILIEFCSALPFLILWLLNKL